MSIPIEITPAGSRHIKRFTYDPESRLLKMHFLNGSVYTHSEVPPRVFNAMMNWTTPGAYYHAVIKKHYAMVDKQLPQGAV